MLWRLASCSGIMLWRLSDQESLSAATCILFGDGTGAMVLSAQQGQCGLLGMDSHSDGVGQKHLNVRPVDYAPHLNFVICGMSS